ncbi:MAG: EAL domain-containing protein [Byssovorax sp.]
MGTTAQAAPTTMPPSSRSRARAATRKGHVLVADDELAILRMYSRALSREGYEVTTATDGLAAKELIEKQRFDVILTDVCMPGMDGISLLRLVRAYDRDVPVILATGAPTGSDAGDAVEFGALLYLIKPCELKTLLQVVEHAIRMHDFAKVKRAAMNDIGAPEPRVAGGSSLEAQMDEALSQLWIAFQPIVSYRERSIFGYEALARSSSLRLSQPHELIHAAERVDRLNDLGRAIRDRVAASMLRESSTAIFVNLHTRDLGDDRLYAPDAPLSRMAERVVLEITERASLDTIGDAARRIARLREMGYRIAVDDMGAGYAGLTAFAEIKPDLVKLDMSLIRGIDADPVKRNLVRAMTAVCRDSGILVVAEGIETIAERDVVAEIGCDLMQGYLFARPNRTFPAVTF